MKETLDRAAKTSPMTPSFCYAQLPPAGLGNRLLVWARALVFARLNQMPLLVSPWEHLQVHRRLRRDADQRRYGDYFVDASPLNAWEKWRILHLYPKIVEPPLQPLEQTSSHQHPTLYIFNQMPHWSDYFQDLGQRRESIRTEIEAMLAPSYRDQLATLNSPAIGVHVRMGDFRPLQNGEDFAKVGAVRAPLEYFEQLINGIREIHGSTLPVTLFSDGQDEELAPLLQLPAVHRARHNAAIVDLLLLAKSRVVIASAGSTFSAWSGFLADAPFLLHPDHIHAPIRSPEVNQHFFEGGVRGPSTSWPASLRHNIRDIKI